MLTNRIWAIASANMACIYHLGWIRLIIYYRLSRPKLNGILGDLEDNVAFRIDLQLGNTLHVGRSWIIISSQMQKDIFKEWL